MWGLQRRRTPGRWLVVCRDFAGRKRTVLVTPTDDGRVAIAVPAGEIAVFDPLAVGQIRAALRDAVIATARPDTQHHHRHAVAPVRMSA